jgi:hypothetical protein
MKKNTVKISALALAIMFAFPAFSQITLKYNLKKGEALKQNMVTSMNLAQKIMDQEMKIDMTIDMQSTYDVKDVQGDNYVMDMTYKAMKMSMAMPGGAGNMTFDSNTAEDVATPQNMGAMLKAIVNKPLEIVMSKTGKVESVKGVEKLNEAMVSSLDKSIPDQMKQQLVTQFGSQFSEEALKTMFTQNSNFFPDKPVNTGDSWNLKSSTTVSNFKMDIDMKMTLKSIENDAVNIAIEGTVSTPEGYEQEINGMKAKITLKGKQQGLVKVNKNTGWIISSKITQNFDGNIEAMGMQIPLSATSTITITDK